MNSVRRSQLMVFDSILRGWRMIVSGLMPKALEILASRLGQGQMSICMLLSKI